MILYQVLLPTSHTSQIQTMWGVTVLHWVNDGTVDRNIATIRITVWDPANKSQDNVSGGYATNLSTRVAASARLSGNPT